MTLDGLLHIKNSGIPPQGAIMNRVVIERSIGLDRIATWNEVRYAMAFPSQAPFESVDARDDLVEMDSSVNGRACDLSEDDMWLAIATEMPDSKCN